MTETENNSENVKRDKGSLYVFLSAYHIVLFFLFSNEFSKLYISSFWIFLYTIISFLVLKKILFSKEARFRKSATFLIAINSLAYIGLLFYYGTYIQGWEISTFAVFELLYILVATSCLDWMIIKEDYIKAILIIIFAPIIFYVIGFISAWICVARGDCALY